MYLRFAPRSLHSIVGVLIAVAVTSQSYAQQAGAPENLCPYSEAELSKALGASVKGKRPKSQTFAGIKALTCGYGEFPLVVDVEQLQMEKTSAAERAMLTKMYAGKMEPIAGDADGAAWQTGLGDLEAVTLFYFRNGVQTQIRVALPNADMKKPDKVADMRKRVLALRRLP